MNLFSMSCNGLILHLNNIFHPRILQVFKAINLASQQPCEEVTNEQLITVDVIVDNLIIGLSFFCGHRDQHKALFYFLDEY